MRIRGACVGHTVRQLSSQDSLNGVIVVPLTLIRSILLLCSRAGLYYRRAHTNLCLQLITTQYRAIIQSKNTQG